MPAHELLGVQQIPLTPSGTRGNTRSVAVPGAILLHRFVEHATRAPDTEGLRVVTRGRRSRSGARADDAVEVVSVGELLARARAVAAGLLGLGAEPGARVAIVSWTRAEWVILDLACQLAGLISVPIFPNELASNCQRFLTASDCRFAVAEDPWQARKLLDAAPHLPVPLELIVIDEDLTLASGGVARFAELGARTPRTFAALEALGRRALETHPELLAEREAATLPDACITIAFTPGTEGQAKGVIITHAMLGAVVDGILGVLPTLATPAKPEPAPSEPAKTDKPSPKADKKRPPDVQLLTLPLAQTLGRVSLWVGLAGHHPTGLARSEATAFDDVRLVEPTFIIGVPSLFERAATAALREVRDGSGFVPFIGRWAHGAKRDEGAIDRIRRGLFDQMIRGAVRRRFGRGCTTLISSGAPLPEGVANLFARAGLPLREAYGMVETCAMTHLDSGAPPALGTVGRPLPGVEARLAPDGELLLRGPSIMPGYWRDAAETRHVLDADGWFATGDLAHADDQQRLVITGRKRDIIVLSDGRSVAPRPIETALREDELIAQALVHGERRRYLTALIALDRAALERFAAAESLPGDFDALSRSAKVHQHIDQAIARVNTTLPPHANIKKFAVLAAELSTEAGELTPTHTLRRSMAAEKFRPLLDSFYAESF